MAGALGGRLAVVHRSPLAALVASRALKESNELRLSSRLRPIVALCEELSDEVEGATVAREEKSGAKAKNLQGKADAEGDLEDTISTMAEDKKYVDDLVATCEQKATDFQVRYVLFPLFRSRDRSTIGGHKLRHSLPDRPQVHSVKDNERNRRVFYALVHTATLAYSLSAYLRSTLLGRLFSLVFSLLSLFPSLPSLSSFPFSTPLFAPASLPFPSSPSITFFIPFFASLPGVSLFQSLLWLPSPSSLSSLLSSLLLLLLLSSSL